MMRYVDRLVRALQTFCDDRASQATLGPILLGYNKDSSDESHSSTSWKALPRHKDEDQVELDVNRSFIYYPKGRPSVTLS